MQLKVHNLDSKYKNMVSKTNNDSLVMGMTRVSGAIDSLLVRTSSGVTYSTVTDYDDVGSLECEKCKCMAIFKDSFREQDQLQGSFTKSVLLQGNEIMNNMSNNVYNITMTFPQASNQNSAIK